MKTARLLFFLLLLTIGFFQGKAQSCCDKTMDMQLLALNADFKALHPSPEPFAYTPQAGSKMIQFPTADGKQGSAFYVPSKKATNKVLIVFHEWWGLNDYIKQEAERWQEQLGGDIDVYAVDLYDGKVGTNPDEAGKLMHALTQQRGDAIVKGLLQKLGTNKCIATLGWCMGGSWSFTGAVAAGRQCVGCVMYYGFPEQDVKRIQPLQADVLYIRGDKDKSIPENAVKELEQKVTATGHDFSLRHFDAPHAFANPSNPAYDKEMVAEAEAMTLAFLKKKLEL
jgi:carboxymethylenebutenolidase